MKKRMPGKFAHTLAFILTFCLTLTIFCAGVSYQAVRVLTDKALHQDIAVSETVLTAQMERITAEVESVAKAQSFNPETVLALITPDAVRDYNLQAVDWWTGLMGSDPVLTAPEWDAAAIQEAVRTDALFQENVKSTLRRSTARDKAAYPIAQRIQEIVLPIRTQLISFAMPEVLSRIDVPGLIDLVSKAPLLCLVASSVLTALLLLVMHRRLCKGGLYIGSALSASALLTLLMMLGVSLLNPVALVAQANALLGLQLSLLLGKLAQPLLLCCIAELAAGIVLTLLHQKKMRILVARSIAA